MDRIKRAFKNLFLFLTSGIFLKNLVGMIAFLFLLLFFTSYWMRCYTNHGESLQVHDYLGMDLDDAIEKAKTRSFSVVVIDSIHVSGKSPGVVHDQNPRPLARVKEKRKIYLTITKTIPDKVTLPDLYGGNDDYYSYQRKLKIIGVKSKVVGRKFSSKLQENTILEVLFKGDTITDRLDDKFQVPKESVMEFIITEKSGGDVPIPDLICQKYDAARFLISNYNLNVGSVIKDATVSDVYSSYVWKQVPRYNTKGRLRIGEQIDVYITQRKPKDCGGSFNIEDGRGDIKPKKKEKVKLKKTNKKKPVEPVLEENEEFED